MNVYGVRKFRISSLRHILVIFCLLNLFISGCASNSSPDYPSYKQPKEGNRSRLRLVTTSSSGGVTFYHHDGKCSKSSESILSSYYLRSGNESIGIPADDSLFEYDDPNFTFKEMYVESNKNIHVLGYYGVTSSSHHPSGVTTKERNQCESKIEFIPESGKDYQLDFNIVFSTGRCYMGLFEVITENNMVKKIPTKAVQNTPNSTKCSMHPPSLSSDEKKVWSN
ncbi:MAG: hypothetical protein D6B28_02745 [Gammaproteobacteria bacterium]|nr:MAG: hypothetical protein D6B28_02745 [Gammaproteobacteria bacterium]